MACSMVFLALFLGAAHTGEAMRAKVDLDEPNFLDASQFLPLCDPRIVHETCELVAGEGAERMTSEQLREVLSASSSDVEQFWHIVGLSDKHVVDGEYVTSCMDLCRSLTEYIDIEDVLPNTSDVSCHDADGVPVCDLDVRPSALLKEIPDPNKDLPDLHDTATLKKVGNDSAEAQEVGTSISDEDTTTNEIAYNVWELVERTANLFRIYPMAGPSNSDTASNVSSSLIEAVSRTDWMKVREKQVQAQAFVQQAIRAFRSGRDGNQLKKWFNTNGLSAEHKEQVLKALNSAEKVLSKASYVYPGSECTGAAAYVWAGSAQYACPDPTKKTCTKAHGKYIIYLCDQFMTAMPSSEQINTLIHEASHHATAYLNDVCVVGQSGKGCDKAYGRANCQTLAARDPDRAIKNADNFCYYVEDVATRVSDVPAPAPTPPPAPPAARCPSFAKSRVADEDGDCKCASGECYEDSKKRCQYSGGNKYHHGRNYKGSLEYFQATCTNCKCKSRAGSKTAPVQTYKYEKDKSCSTGCGESYQANDGSEALAAEDQCFKCVSTKEGGCPWDGYTQYGQKCCKAKQCKPCKPYKYEKDKSCKLGCGESYQANDGSEALAAQDQCLKCVSTEEGGCPWDGYKQYGKKCCKAKQCERVVVSATPTPAPVGVDPCTFKSCGKNAQCVAYGLEAKCECKPEYECNFPDRREDCGGKSFLLCVPEVPEGAKCCNGDGDYMWVAKEALDKHWGGLGGKVCPKIGDTKYSHADQWEDACEGNRKVLYRKGEPVRVGA